ARRAGRRNGDAPARALRRPGAACRRELDADVHGRARRRAAAAPRRRSARRPVVHRTARPAARRVSARAARLAIAALALVGPAITTYRLYPRYSGSRIACPTSGCETVQHSRYAELGGAPVAALGLAGYLALLATTFCRSEWARAAAVAISFAALTFSAYLLIV